MVIFAKGKDASRMGFLGLFGKGRRETLENGLQKTRESVLGKLRRVVAGKSTVDDDVLDGLEDALITSDVGVETTLEIIERIEARVKRDKYVGTQELRGILREEIMGLLSERASEETARGEAPEGVPYVLMVVGVNGVGKTTTIGKLAYRLGKEGKRVVIGAADTFRAAAQEQLEVWAERAGATLVKGAAGADPASVAFEAVRVAKTSAADVVLVDTAGRLHNKVGLMQELTKIRNVMGKQLAGAPHEVMLVVDGGTGQNAFEQARQFSKATSVSSLCVTKLDGTAKGGVVVGISHLLGVPVRFIGLGEGIEDLQVFDRRAFVESLFEE